MKTYRNITLADAFAMLETAAASGARCPIAGTNGLTSLLTSELAHAGKIRVEIYPHNWRVVTIMAGPHAGKATASPPDKTWRPYRTIEAAQTLKEGRR